MNLPVSSSTSFVFLMLLKNPLSGFCIASCVKDGQSTLMLIVKEETKKRWEERWKERRESQKERNINVRKGKKENEEELKLPTCMALRFSISSSRRATLSSRELSLSPLIPALNNALIPALNDAIINYWYIEETSCLNKCMNTNVLYHC